MVSSATESSILQTLGTSDAPTTNENIASSDALAAQGRLADDFDTFLLLLTTQLQNQNPTDPLDTNQFTEQLVQFASVEQQVAQNENLEKLVQSSEGTDQANAVNYVGKIVEVESEAVVINEGTDLLFSYVVTGEVDRTDILLRDASGRVVFSAEGSTNQGRIDAGIAASDLAANGIEPGLYTVEVNLVKNGVNGGGDILNDAVVLTTGIATEAKLTGDQVTLNVNGADVPVDRITAVGIDLTTSLNGQGGGSTSGGSDSGDNTDDNQDSSDESTA